MTKEEVQGRVTHYGIPLTLSRFTWDADTGAFASSVSNLTIEFGDIWGCTFDTWHGCTFNTGWGCTFDTESGCTFNTGNWCTFNTGFNCTFRTGYDCIFSTMGDCTWRVSNRNYSYPPLYIQGSMWSVNVYEPGRLKIGCEDRTFEEWNSYAVDIAEKEEVTPEVLKEYLGLIEVAKVWAKQKGWLLPK